ncbi:putative electron transfer flavoprotein, beta subunit [Candidatus Zinderia insecticola CARI]|uniref:Electron transfer flavoprotein subunit beta n=1 Tax=Zinderia insecticola (strain CARI) TaxID=871271 RepID=E0TIR7_ZINIC|nr:putative electron transfer flavoprotein, beta subunit [Candidatus Zinderia insecticola CARI]
MNILVPIKGVIDPNINLVVENNNINYNNYNLIINPFDEIALEASMQLKENKKNCKVISITCSNLNSKEILQKSLAFGIDESILINNDENIELSPLIISKLLKNIVEKKNIDLIIMGKQQINEDNHQLGQMLAGILNWPQAICVSNIVLKKDKIIVTKEIDFGLENLSLELPALITVDLRLNEPRFISLSNIIKSKKKNIEIINIKDINIDKISKLKKIKYSINEKEKKKIKFINIKELFEKLKEFNIIK